MLKRYTKDTDGNTRLLAVIYTKDEHKINNDLIDDEALSVLNILASKGYEAYLVGGAVRDLALGLSPKDFDVATNAHPRDVRKLFRLSRIIGRRFQIVHVPFKDQIIEVSTFRSEEASDDENNKFGTLKEDANRRDFTVNSLYYDPFKSQMIDFHGGFNDLKNHILKPIIPISTSFTGDPIRMIRAIKYAVKCDLSIDSEVKGAFYKYGGELGKVSESRLVEEFNKILLSGCSLDILNRLEKYELLLFIAPRISEEIFKKNKELLSSLTILDKKIQNNENIQLKDAYAYLMSFIVSKKEVEKLNLNERSAYVSQLLQKGLRPLNVPNVARDKASDEVLEMKGIEFLVRSS